MKDIFWTPLAKASYVDVKNFLLEHWNDTVHDDFENLVNIRIDQIQKNPNFSPII